MRPFIGYHRPEKLPIKPGQVATIPKGAPVKRMGKPVKPAGRTYKVKVDHVLCGIGGIEVTHRNPSIRWAGTGGYWCEVDINLIPEANN